MVYQRMLIIFTIVQSNWHPPAAEQARLSTHSHPSFLTHQGWFPLKHILNNYQSLQCTQLSLKKAAPRSWSRFYCTWEHLATVLLLHLEVGGVIQTKHPKGVLHRGMSPHRDAQKLLLLGGVLQVPRLKRHPVGGAVSVWPSIPLTGLLLHTRIWLIFTWLTYQKACERLYR